LFPQHFTVPSPDNAHEKVPPDATLVMFERPATVIGEETRPFQLLVSVPHSAEELLPQHLREPSFRTAQVCPLLESRRTTPDRPDTTTGV
jgi:hypothetical protein